MRKYIVYVMALTVLLAGCGSKSSFVPPSKVQKATLEGEFVIIEDYYYQTGNQVTQYFRAFIDDSETLYVIDAPYKPAEEGYQMESYTYDDEGVVDSYTLFVDEYGIRSVMEEGTLLGVGREDFVLKENGKKVVIIHSGQYAVITGKTSNNSVDDLPGIPLFKISSDDDIDPYSP